MSYSREQARLRPGSRSVTMPRRVALVSWNERPEAAWKEFGRRSWEPSRLFGRTKPRRCDTSGASWWGRRRPGVGRRRPLRPARSLSRQSRMPPQQAIGAAGYVRGRARVPPSGRRPDTGDGRAAQDAGRLLEDSGVGHSIGQDGGPRAAAGSRERHRHGARADGAPGVLPLGRVRPAESCLDARPRLQAGAGSAEPSDARHLSAIEVPPTGDL